MWNPYVENKLKNYQINKSCFVKRAPSPWTVAQFVELPQYQFVVFPGNSMTPEEEFENLHGGHWKETHSSLGKEGISLAYISLLKSRLNLSTAMSNRHL